MWYILPSPDYMIHDEVCTPLPVSRLVSSASVSLCRCLKAEQQLRPASLPAIPNPFPELCSPAGSPILSPIQTSDSHASTPAPCHLHYTLTETHWRTRVLEVLGPLCCYIIAEINSVLHLRDFCLIRSKRGALCVLTAEACAF